MVAMNHRIIVILNPHAGWAADARRIAKAEE